MQKLITDQSAENKYLLSAQPKKGHLYNLPLEAQALSQKRGCGYYKVQRLGRSGGKKCLLDMAVHYIHELTATVDSS